MARELAELAEKFQRFRGPINRLRHHVLVQMRSEAWKCQAVLECLRFEEPTSIEEIVDETALDRQSVGEALEMLTKPAKPLAEKCNRNGEAVLIRRDGKPAEKVYWRKAGRRPSTVR